MPPLLVMAASFFLSICNYLFLDCLLYEVELCKSKAQVCLGLCCIHYLF